MADVPADGLLNDMIVGPDGRAWFGNTGFRLGVEDPRRGASSPTRPPRG
ncbi:hypothetical protein [Kutzneria sp. 744]|nr:hypothetical protein [Kutzneria sp. 744]